MYEIIRWLPNGDPKYYTGDSFSGNPFNAKRYTLEAAQTILSDLLDEGYRRDDLEIVPA